MLMSFCYRPETELTLVQVLPNTELHAARPRTLRGLLQWALCPKLWGTMTLLEKIEANAKARLILPPGALPRQELGRYKNFLKVETHRLKLLHRAGASGREICQARSAILDLLLRHILTGIRNTSP